MSERDPLKVELAPGPCLITLSDRGLASLRFPLGGAGEVLDRPARLSPPAEQAELWQEVVGQLRAYFAGQLQQFDLPVDLTGRTEFQERVLRACCDIPYGATVSYGELVGRSGHPRAARAVGQVMATNRIALVVPCHRVIGSSGGLTGYGYGLAFKERLLALEQWGGGWEEIVAAQGPGGHNGP